MCRQTESDRKTDRVRQTGRQTDRQTGRQADRQDAHLYRVRQVVVSVAAVDLGEQIFTQLIREGRKNQLRSLN